MISGTNGASTNWRTRVAECVLPGHPDKVCDAVCDGIVQAAMERDCHALVAVEAAVFRRTLHVTGRIAGVDSHRFRIDALVRRVLRSARYSAERGLDPRDLNVELNLERERLLPGEAEFRAVSDDQAVIIGYANTTPGTGGVPVEQALVRRLGRALHGVVGGDLGPDGKVMVEVLEDPAGAAWRLGQVTVSLMHGAGWDEVATFRRVDAALLSASRAFAVLVPGFEVPDRLSMVFNAAGPFVCGGPDGDNGLSGKKLVVDFYGPRVPIGGGAMSGKDFWKVDRAGPLIAHDAAVEAVERFGCRSATVVLGIGPGDRAFRLERVDAENGLGLDRVALSRRLDLRLCSRCDWWRGRDLIEVARWGHFGDASGAAVAVAKTDVAA